MGFNIVMVTHDIDEAVIMADRTLVMAGSPGKMVHDMKVDLPDPRNREDQAVRSLRSNLMQVFEDVAKTPTSSDGN
jgi:NitT/TauT family transport system ATP-binding protein